MLLPRLLRGSCRDALPKAIPRSYRTCQRSFATSLRRHNLTAEDDHLSKLPNIDPSQLSVTETITPKQLVPNQDLIFGRTFTGQSAGTLDRPL